MPDDLWRRWRGVVCGWPAVARIGADPAAWTDAVALAGEAGATDFSITVPRGTVRAAFAAGSARRIGALRQACARRGWPVTLERADVETMAAAGAWGAMNDATQRLATALRTTLDPGGTPILWT